MASGGFIPTQLAYSIIELAETYDKHKMDKKMTEDEDEERMVGVIFNRNRLKAGIHLRHAITGSFLKSNLEGLSAVAGRREEDNGWLFLRFDSVDGKEDYCVRISDVSLFWANGDVYVNIIQAKKLIEEKQDEEAQKKGVK